MFRDTCISRDAPEMLCHIMCSMIPRMGANHDDTGVKFNAFDAIKGESLAHFVSRAVALQQEIADAGVNTVSNALLKRLLKILDSNRRIMMCLTVFAKRFSKSRRSKPNAIFAEHPATDLLNTLTEQGADLGNVHLQTNSNRRNPTQAKNPRQPSPSRNSHSPRVVACDATSYSDVDAPDETINHEKPTVSFLQDIISNNQSDTSNDDDNTFFQVQDQLFELISANPAVVQVIQSNTNEKQCAICDGKHDTFKCCFFRPQCPTSSQTSCQTISNAFQEHNCQDGQRR